MWWSLLAGCILSLLWLGMSLVFMISPWLLTWKGFGFWKAFLASNEMTMGYVFFQFIYMTDFRWIFVYCITLESLEWSLLIMLDDVFDVFLNFICKYFIEYLCISVHKGVWHYIFFFVQSLCCLGSTVTGIRAWVWGYYFCFYFVG